MSTIVNLVCKCGSTLCTNIHDKELDSRVRAVNQHIEYWQETHRNCVQPMSMTGKIIKLEPNEKFVPFIPSPEYKDTPIKGLRIPTDWNIETIDVCYNGKTTVKMSSWKK